MYNKLFTKILDSSIWLEPDQHRLVWITLIAAMDRYGVTQFACAENLAARARVSIEACEAAIAAFEAPDPHDPTQEFEGRRIERIPGGWLVLNAEKYREMVTASVASEKSRERMRKFREKNRVTPGYDPLRSVTPSVSVSVSEADRKVPTEPVPQSGTVNDNFQFVGKVQGSLPECALAIVRVFEHWKTVHRHDRARLDDKRKTLIRKAMKSYSEADICQAISGYCNSPHHMGQNERATVYDDIELMLKDAKHIDAGIKFYAQPPRADLSEKTRKVISQTEGWTPRSKSNES